MRNITFNLQQGVYYLILTCEMPELNEKKKRSVTNGGKCGKFIGCGICFDNNLLSLLWFRFTIQPANYAENLILCPCGHIKHAEKEELQHIKLKLLFVVLTFVCHNTQRYKQ